MSVQLALYKGKGDVFNAAIRWWTDSQYSHCELVVDGWCYSSSAMDKGVRRKVIDLTPDKWVLIELPWADAASVIHYFAESDSHAYGYIGLITAQLFNSGKGQNKAQFCSEWCARALGVPSPSIYSPATLGALLAWGAPIG